MISRLGRNTIIFEKPLSILGYAAVCGKKEKEGPLGKYFDKAYTDNKFGEETWEKSESHLQTDAVQLAIEKAKLLPQDINYIFSGDLLNQCISSVFGLRDFNIPYLGQYGACSTMAQTIAMASVFVASGCGEYCSAVTSSHFCSAEKQFRFPLDYGGQRTPTAQWTVTGSGSVVIGKGENAPFIKAVTVGKIIDLGITDPNNMGAAMAPAAADTIKTYLNDTGKKPDDFDLILTGDLGRIGSTLLIEMLDKEGINISSYHNDCGLMIFDMEKQDVHAGGSGCGCSGSVLCGYILDRVKNENLDNILFIATGALMSPTSSQQGESIPSVAHLVHISKNI